MNERDKELALQAGDYVTKVYTPPVRSKTPGKIWEDGHVGWHAQFNAKFADLIRADEREKVLAGERIRIGVRLETLKTAIELLKAENTELKDELKVRENK